MNNKYDKILKEIYDNLKRDKNFKNIELKEYNIEFNRRKELNKNEYEKTIEYINNKTLKNIKYNREEIEIILDYRFKKEEEKFKLDKYILNILISKDINKEIKLEHILGNYFINMIFNNDNVYDNVLSIQENKENHYELDELKEKIKRYIKEDNNNLILIYINEILNKKKYKKDLIYNLLFKIIDN